jgi:hypothetical protein
LEKRSKTQPAIKASRETRKWETAKEMDEKRTLGVYPCNLILENGTKRKIDTFFQKNNSDTSSYKKRSLPAQPKKP